MMIRECWFKAGVLFGLMALSLCAHAVQSSVQAGRDLFETYCSTCHTTNSRTTIGPGLRHVMKKRTERYVRGQITNGKNAMPAFKDQLSKKEMNDLIQFLKTL